MFSRISGRLCDGLNPGAIQASDTLIDFFACDLPSTDHCAAEPFVPTQTRSRGRGPNPRTRSFLF